MDTEVTKVEDCWNKIGVWAPSAERTCPRLKDVVHCANCDVFSSAGRKLLECNPPEGYLKEWGGFLSSTKKGQEQNTHSMILFRLGDEWLGLETNLLDEIVSVRPFHSLPHRKSLVLRGLINIRGELQLCVSVGHLMNITRGEISGTNVVKGVYERMIVVSSKQATFVFPVSEVRGVYRYNESDIKDAPATAMNCSVHYLKGMLDLEGRHVGIIDDALLFPALERGIL